MISKFYPKRVTRTTFRAPRSAHYHIRCLDCDRVIDSPPGFDVCITHEPVENTDFKIIGHKLVFIGICPACLKHPQTC